ncbi:DinB family protein [Foetidibacter luteolus]|uniref:DinB family protein n=1 Tax=Foetidibacter luteolus TaxID=2608880 RepID=UPI00129ACBDA|nr:DinB family protein [Foetidibacter luteolus]
MKNKILANAYADEIKAEVTSTRKCLERVTENLYDYKPHPKSMAMGYLAVLVAEIPLWVAVMVEEGEIDLATFQHLQTKTTEALVGHFDENIKRAERALHNATDEALDGTFTLKSNGHVLYSSPMLESISSTINHWVHHRGQLTVYLRLNDIAVPSIYGPSADDNQFKQG